MAKIFIPPLLRDLAGDDVEIVVEGENLRQIITALDKRYPGIADRLRAGDKLADGLAVSVDGAITTRGLLTPVGPASEIHFLPAISGG